MNKNKELTPLQQLRLQKSKYKKSYLADEERLTKNWNYLTNNTSTVIFNTIFGGSKRSQENREGVQERIQTPFGSIGSFSSVFSGLAGSLPIIWEVVQPMLISLAIKKIKGLFSSKKKKQKKNDD